MARPQIVLDTNVLVAGLRSRSGASFRLLDLVGEERFDIHLSVPLIFEYEDALARQVAQHTISAEAMEAVLDFHCAVAERHQIFFLWRPYLRDPRDDMVLELAVRAGAAFVITYNTRDFAGIEDFGVRAIPPAVFLRQIGEIE